jgi:hypothetical protein
MRVESFLADRWTDMTKLIVAFCNFFVNMPKTTKFLTVLVAASAGQNVKKFLPCEMRGSHSSVAEGSSCMEC